MTEAQAAQLIAAVKDLAGLLGVIALQLVSIGVILYWSRVK
jgi:hypothetical protein